MGHLPPSSIDSRRWSYVILFFLASSFAGTCVWMMMVFMRHNDPFVSDYVLFVGLLFLSLWGARSALRRVVMPPKALFTPSSFAISVGGRTRIWPWAEIETADLRTAKTQFVILRLKSAPQPKTRWWLKVRRSTNLDYPFNISPEDLRQRILQGIAAASLANGYDDMAERGYSAEA
jgi:hypothetical protein